MKTPIGLIIREVIEEKNLSIPDIAVKMGTSRQNVYQTFGRKTMPANQLEKWSSVIGITVEDLLKKQNLSTNNQNKSIDSGAFGQEVLDKVIEELKNQYEARIHELKDQIGDLREQLKFNREMVQAFKEGQLGKSKGTPNGQSAGYLND